MPLLKLLNSLHFAKFSPLSSETTFIYYIILRQGCSLKHINQNSSSHVVWLDQTTRDELIFSSSHFPKIVNFIWVPVRLDRPQTILAGTIQPLLGTGPRTWNWSEIFVGLFFSGRMRWNSVKKIQLKKKKKNNKSSVSMFTKCLKLAHYLQSSL